MPNGTKRAYKAPHGSQTKCCY